MRQLAGIGIVMAIVPVVWFMLQRSGGTETILKGISAAVALTLIYLTVRHQDRRERRNMTAYLILTIGSLMFWSLYQMAPNGLMLFAVHNVDLMVGPVKIQPQWIQNINTVCIVLGGPIFAAFFTRMRARGWKIDIPQQFAASLLLMAPPFSFSRRDQAGRGDGKSAFLWLFMNYVLQSIGELLLMPVGYAMIGKLAPKQYQGMMMGSWMLVTGLASLFAGDFSGMIPNRPARQRSRPTRVRETLRRARRGQPRGRHRARRADSVPAQADHRQGRDNSPRNRDGCSRHLNRGMERADARHRR